jgi:MFS family permease
VPLRGELEAFNALWLGTIGSAYFGGFVIGCVAGPYFILRVGHIRAFTAMVAAASAVAILHPLIIDPLSWSILRAITGFCLAGLYLIIESWLNERATNDNRGFVMSIYIMVNFSMITVGQLMILTYPPQDFALFTLASVLISLAAIPVAMTRAEQPAPIALVQFRPKALIKATPVGMIGSFMVGIANGAFWALGAVFATRRGFSPNDAAIFLSVAVIGGAVSQYPLGRLSDFVDRRLILLASLTAAAVIGILLGVAPLSGWLLYVFGFLLGAFMLPTYALAAAHAYDCVSRDTYVEAAAGLLLVNGVGSVIGPIVASIFIKTQGAGALFIFTAIIQLLLCVFIVYRLRTRKATSAADKVDYNVAATANIGGVISPESYDIEDDSVVMPEWVETSYEDYSDGNPNIENTDNKEHEDPSGLPDALR